jgi:adenylylsulfate kinase
VFVTGLPSSGKSTLGAALATKLRARGVAVALLDGDEIRGVLVPRPGYDDQARHDFYASLAGIAGVLAAQGLVVVIAATANRSAYREMARARAPRFIEVLVDVDANECARRDAKGLYAAERTGAVQGLPGADASYERPTHADVVATGGHDSSAIDRVVALLGP